MSKGCLQHMTCLHGLAGAAVAQGAWASHGCRATGYVDASPPRVSSKLLLTHQTGYVDRSAPLSQCKPLMCILSRGGTLRYPIPAILLCQTLTLRGLVQRLCSRLLMHHRIRAGHRIKHRACFCKLPSWMGRGGSSAKRDASLIKVISGACW